MYILDSYITMLCSDNASYPSAALDTPDTVWRLVLEMLDGRSLSRMACVSRRFDRLAADSALWREISFSGSSVTSLEAALCLRGSAYTRAVKLKLPSFSMYTLTTADILTNQCTNLVLFGFVATGPIFGRLMPLTPLPPSVTRLSLSQVMIYRDEDQNLFTKLHTLVLDRVLFCGFGNYVHEDWLSHLINVTARCGTSRCHSGNDGVCIVGSMRGWKSWNPIWVLLDLSSTCLYDGLLVSIIRHASHLRRLYVDDCLRLMGGDLRAADVSHLDVFSAKKTPFALMNKNSRGH